MEGNLWIRACQNTLQWKPKFFLNHLDVVYETGKTVFNQISNKRVKNMRRSEVFLKKIEVFGNVVKPCLQCLTYMYRYLKS